MSIKEQPDQSTRKPDEVFVRHEDIAGDAGRPAVEVISLAIDDADAGNDPYNQTGRFVSLALKDQGLD